VYYPLPCYWARLNVCCTRSLRAESLETASGWCDKLRPRVQWAKENEQRHQEADMSDSDEDELSPGAARPVSGVVSPGTAEAAAVERDADRRTRLRGMSKNLRKSFVVADGMFAKSSRGGVAGIGGGGGAAPGGGNPFLGSGLPPSLAEAIAEEDSEEEAAPLPSRQRVPPPPPSSVVAAPARSATRSLVAYGGPSAAPPSRKGWLFKQSPSRFKSWQKRWIVLNSKGLFYFQNESTADFNNSVALNTIAEVRPCSGRHEEREFEVITVPQWGRVFQLRAKSAPEMRDWVATLTAALKHAAGTAAAKAKRRAVKHKVPLDDGDVDSDDSDGEGGGIEGGRVRHKVPQWMAQFDAADDAQRMGSIRQYFGAAFEGVAAGGDTSLLHEAILEGNATMDERLGEAQGRGRSDIVLAYLRVYDLQIIQELGVCIGAGGLSAIKSDRILKLMDAVEGYMGLRSRALGGVAVSDPALVQSILNNTTELAEQIKVLMEQYMTNISPELRRIRENTVTQVMGKGLDSVRQDTNCVSRSRLKTNMPFDFFQLLEIPLSMAKRGGSPALQRRLLSKVMEEVTMLSRDVLSGVQDRWRGAPNDLEEDYVCALTNDCGTLLDLLEQLEVRFTSIIVTEQQARQLKAEASRSMGLSVSLGVGGGCSPAAASVHPGGNAEIRRALSSQMYAEDEDDLSAVRQDLPRAQRELKNCACSLSNVLRDIVMADLLPHINGIGTPAWAAEGGKGGDAPIPLLIATLADYFDEFEAYLDPFFFRNLAGQVLQAVMTAYIAKLVRVATAHGQVFTRARHLTPAQQRVVKHDVDLLNSSAAEYILDEDRVVLFKPLFFARDVLTCSIQEDETTGKTFFDVMHQHLVNLELASMPWYLTIQALLLLRHDLSKPEYSEVMDRCRTLFGEAGSELGDAVEKEMLLLASPSSWTPALGALAAMRALWPDSDEQYELWLEQRVEWAQAQADKDAAAAAAAAASANRGKGGFLSGLFGGGKNKVDMAQAAAAEASPTPQSADEGGATLTLAQIGISSGARQPRRQRSASRVFQQGDFSNAAPQVSGGYHASISEDLPDPDDLDFDGPMGSGSRQAVAPAAAAAAAPPHGGYGVGQVQAAAAAPQGGYGGGAAAFTRKARVRRRGVDEEEDW